MGMFPRKSFENLRTVVALLVLFEQFLGKFCYNFLPRNLSVSPNMMHFVRAFSIIYVWGVRLIANEKVRNCKKIVFIKNMFENDWWGMHPPHPPDAPLPALIFITMSLTSTPTSRFGFSMMRGEFYHSCFEIITRTALAQFGHFTLKTRVWFQKGEVRPPNLPWVLHCTNYAKKNYG